MHYHRFFQARGADSPFESPGTLQTLLARFHECLQAHELPLHPSRTGNRSGFCLLCRPVHLTLAGYVLYPHDAVITKICRKYKNYRIDTTKIRRDILDDYAGEEDALVDYLMNEAASSYEHELGTATVKSIDSLHWRKEIEFGLLEDFNPELINKTLPDV